MRSVPILALLLLPAAARGGEERPPNVIVLLADDHAARDLSCAGHPVVRTPALDRLAREGVRFTQAFATTSLCSPGRASLLSGQWTRTHGVLGNRDELAPDTATFATALTAAGWDSAYVGKWHMAEQGGPRPGFRWSATYDGQGVHHGQSFRVGAQTLEERPSEGWVDDVATEYALEFLAREREGPFLLVLGFKSPHGPRIPHERHARFYRADELPEPPNARAFPPFPTERELQRLISLSGAPLREYEPPEDWLEHWEGERLPDETLFVGGRGTDEDLRDYYRLLRGVDDCVRRLLVFLDERGLAEDTLVLYVSDNGMCNGEHGLIGKRVAYEESIRIPLLARWPRGAPAGALRDELVLNVDLAPTILELCGVEPPASMQGASLAPLLAGKSPPWREDFLYEFWHEGRRSWQPSLVALRTRTHKLVRYQGRPAWTELFDLARDPHELRDLSREAEQAELRARLEERLAAHEARLGPRPAR